jgi:Transcriptional regulatory protein, C terminal
VIISDDFSLPVTVRKERPSHSAKTAVKNPYCAGPVLKFESQPDFPFGQVIPMVASTDQKTGQLYGFGPFRVDPEKELLLRDYETVPLPPKAFQVLLVLMRHNKQVVTKDDLLKMVWPDTFVEEANLSRNIFLLRKALGESRKTISTSSPSLVAVTGLPKACASCRTGNSALSRRSTPPCRYRSRSRNPGHRLRWVRS